VLRVDPFYPKEKNPYLVHHAIEGLRGIRAASETVLLGSQHECAISLEWPRLATFSLHILTRVKHCERL
jgi:hypothetical protein